MDIYYLICISSIIISCLLPSANEKEYKWRVSLSFLPLFLFGALRVNFGLDYSTYESLFNVVHATSRFYKDSNTEIGFLYLLKILPDWRYVITFGSFVLCLSWIVLLYRNVVPRGLTFALILIFCIGNMTIYTPLVAMRNGLTIGIMMLCFPLIEQRRYILVLAIAFLGHYIHSSLLIFMPIALLVGRNTILKKREIFIWTGVVVVLLVISATSLIEIVTPYILAYFERYENVLATMSESKHVSYLANAADIVLMGSVLTFFYKNRTQMTPSENSYFRIGLIYLCCSFLGALGGARMQAYFLPFFILILVKMYSAQWKDNFMKCMFFIFVFAFFLYQFYYVWQWNNPYFVFQEYESILD